MNKAYTDLACQTFLFSIKKYLSKNINPKISLRSKRKKIIGYKKYVDCNTFCLNI